MVIEKLTSGLKKIMTMRGVSLFSRFLVFDLLLMFSFLFTVSIK